VLTGFSAITTAVMVSYTSAYGPNAVMEALVAGLVMMLHCVFISLLGLSIWKPTRFRRSASVFAICIEVIGFSLILGAFGILGFVVAMVMLMLLTTCSLLIGQFILTVFD
jgi:membrane glycosyltransferase